MKFSEAWLREWVNPPLSTEELAEQMTLMGLEVDEFESAQPAFKGVVVAEVIDAVKHPNADSLRVCTVNYGGDETANIVCGAPNARKGLKAPLATIGARLPGGLKIKKTKLRGVESQGMLCSPAELEFATDSDGLMELDPAAPVGQALEDYLELADHILDVELTPNRGDCLSIRGLARDICARNNMDLALHEISPVAPTINDELNVEVSAQSCCVRYAGRVIRDVDCSRASPVWMVERLRRGGVRSINPAVDITNYVMLELGQPMHAFDLDKLQGHIRVRLAQDQEQVELLDGRDVTLQKDITVIADDRGAIGVAGIMGGQTTAVDESTRNIFFESALFTPEGVAGKAWALDAHTDSSHRFERGVDPGSQVDALEYATGLLLNIADGAAGPVVDWRNDDELPIGPEILLRRERIERYLGNVVDDATIEMIFARLQIQVRNDADGWRVTPPTHRYDLRIEEDYIEELARIHGYDNFPRTSGSYQPYFSEVSETTLSLDSLKNLLCGRGYQEVVTFSFVDEAIQSQLLPDQQAMALSNPISSDLSVMRTSLVTGLLGTLRHNLNRQNNNVRIFESGLKYVKDDFDLKQIMVLGGLISGDRTPESWTANAETVDFFDLKGDLEAIFQRANGHEFELVTGSQPFLHPGVSADILSDGKNVGWIGQLHPQLQKSLDVSQTALMFEVSADALTATQVPKHQEVSRFPSVRRDIAVVVPTSISNESLQQCVRSNGPDWLQKVVTFDVYSGDKVESGMKSVALGLILQDFSRTLEESEVDQTVSQVLDGLKQELGAILRV